MRRAGCWQFMRNVLVAAGNGDDPTLAGLVTAHLGQPAGARHGCVGGTPAGGRKITTANRYVADERDPWSVRIKAEHRYRGEMQELTLYITNRTYSSWLMQPRLVMPHLALPGKLDTAGSETDPRNGEYLKPGKVRA